MIPNKYETLARQRHGLLPCWKEERMPLLVAGIIVVLVVIVAPEAVVAILNAAFAIISALIHVVWTLFTA